MTFRQIPRAKTWAIAALMLAAACTPLPENTERGDLEFFEDAVASIGCDLVTGVDYSIVQFQAGLTREQATGLAAYELESGRAERIESGGLRLTAGPCAPGAEPVSVRLELGAAA